MKSLLILTAALVTAASGFEIPKGTHHLGELKDAAKKAAKVKQPIAFIIAEKKGVAT